MLSCSYSLYLAYMGELERSAGTRNKKKNLQKIILGSVATAGLLSMALVAPNAIQLLAKLGIIDIKKSYKETGNINRARDRLIKIGLLKRDKNGYLRLTMKGGAKIRQLELADYKLKKPKRWDKKWRVLIFDIPEYRKTLREKIRRTLMAMGFTRLQDSVWVYPYPCEDLITLLKADFRIGRELLYLIVEEIERDKDLMRTFGLCRK